MSARLTQVAQKLVEFLETQRKVSAIVAIGTVLFGLGCTAGFVFQWCERQNELDRYDFNRAIYDSLAGTTDFSYCHHPAFKSVGYCQQHEKLEAQLRVFLESAGNSLADRLQWTWLGSFFFFFHLSSTVGYATMGAPETAVGKFFAVIFGIVGIPLFGCMLLIASSYLLQGARAIFGRVLVLGEGADLRKAQLLRLAIVSAAVLWFGATLLFANVEGWSYDRSMFFCFMTFSSVGVGTDMPNTLTGRLASVACAFVALGLFVGIVRGAYRGRLSEELPLVPGPVVHPASHLPKVAFVCLAAVVALCSVGALVLSHFERHAELMRYVRAASVYEGLSEMAAFKGCDDKFIKGMDFCKNVPVFRRRLHLYFGPDTPNSMVDLRHWTGLGSLLFMFSTASTIGYGSQSPHTPGGKVATVAFGLLVVPLFWYCMLVWGASFRWFVHGFVKKTCTHRWLTWTETQRSLISLFGSILVLWVFGSIAFFWLEGWDPATAIYFCFVTLTAVGLDDAMPKTILGRLFMLFYISLGLTSVASFFEECSSALVASLGVSDQERAVARHPSQNGTPRARTDSSATSPRLEAGSISTP